MLKLLFYTSLLAIMSTNAKAQSYNISFDSSSTTSTYTSTKGTLYNFSKDLINAATNCTPYHEDFSNSNPNISNIGTIFGGTKYQVLIDIKGLKDNNCEFEITQNLKGLGGSKYICSITPETQAELLSAMKNRSTELVTETYTTYGTMTSEGITEKFPISQTETDTISKITIRKILAKNCEIEEITPTEEETIETQDNMLKFPNNFISSLNSCTPDKHDFSFFMFSTTIEIIGSKDQTCQVQTPEFNFYIPNNLISDITGLDKLYALSADNNIAKYRAFENYSHSSILLSIDKCEGNGVSTETFGENNQITKSITGLKIDNTCTLKLTNILKTNDTKKDYSLTCKISENNRNKILSKYQHILDDKAKSEERLKAGKSILKSLIKHNLCSKETKD